MFAEQGWPLWAKVLGVIVGLLCVAAVGAISAFYGGQGALCATTEGMENISVGQAYKGADGKIYTVKSYDRWNDDVEFIEDPGVVKLADAQRVKGLMDVAGPPKKEVPGPKKEVPGPKKDDGTQSSPDGSPTAPVTQSASVTSS